MKTRIADTRPRVGHATGRVRRVAWLAVASVCFGCSQASPGDVFDSGQLPQSIELDVDSLVLSVGDTVTVSAVVRDGYGMVTTTNVGWASRDSGVARVTDVGDNGLVEAVDLGSTIIEATVLGTNVPPDSVVVRVN